MPSQQHNHPDKYLRPRADLTKAVAFHEDRVAVKRIDWPETERGLYVPGIARPVAGHQLGEVVSLGPGRSYTTNLSSGKVKRFADGVRDSFSVKLGDKVIYARSPSNEAEDGSWGTVSFLYEEQAILAVLQDGMLRPLYDRIIVKRTPRDTMAGAITIPAEAQKESLEGDVLAVGEGQRLADGRVLPLEIQPGDRVVFGGYAGSDIRIAGEEYTILREYEVIGVRQVAA